MTNSSFKNWLVRGDTHGNFTWLSSLKDEYKPEETAIIVLGDAGINFFLNRSDQRTKEQIQHFGYTLYLVRGNHEMRPEHLETITTKWDDDVGSYIYVEPQYPNIRYFMNYGIYTINNYRCLVIGGAYSIDKWYRLARAGYLTPGHNDPKKTGWFSDECLTTEEMADCDKMINKSGNNHFDFVFSHTCPKKYQPTDLFLPSVDQSTVDNSMEIWMNKISEKIVVNIAWLFGHYHQDRLEQPHVEQYFNDIEALDEITERWKSYDETGSLDWWLVKSINFDISKEE